MISEKEIHNLAELARIGVSEVEAKQLKHDLGKILDHVAELREVDTEGVVPMAGGTALENVLRVDDSNETLVSKESSIAAFPEERNGFLKVPPVFE